MAITSMRALGNDGLHLNTPTHKVFGNAKSLRFDVGRRVKPSVIHLILDTELVVMVIDP